MTDHKLDADLVTGLKAHCEQAVDCLRRWDQPSDRLKGIIDEAENHVVRLRDGLIDQLRLRQAEELRRCLDQVNMSLSLIAGVAYPGPRIHRKYVQEAHQELAAVARRLEALV